MKFKKLLSAYLSFLMSLAFCAEQQLTSEQYQVLAQKSTPVIITFFNKLIEKNIFGIQHLKQLEKAETLINPITPEERVSITVLPWATQLDGWLTYPINIKQINAWATQKIAELKQTKATRERVHEETKEIHRPMRFVPIPPGKYVDEITGAEFEILPGVEIQNAPVTQWQWVQIMGKNPSERVDGPDSEEIIINKKTIKLRPDAPVENVSNNDIQEFINTLNKNNSESFNVPTLQEYQAVIQAAFGSTWLFDVHDKIASRAYLELSKQRIYDLVGTIWQWSLDQVALSDKEAAEIVFGGFKSVDSLKDLVKPVPLINNELSKSFGLRLIRYSPTAKKADKHFYSSKQLSWDWWDSLRDKNWIWDDATKTLVDHDTIFYWLNEHMKSYPQEKQDVINKMFEYPGSSYDCNGYNGVGCKIHATHYYNHGKALHDVSLIPYMQHLQSLDISTNKVYDISPLAQLQHLERLDLDSNFISDAQALSSMITLKKLDLQNNWIKDISFMSQLTNLETLSLSENRITNIEPLAGLIRLSQLNLTWNNIEDISTLATLINLTDLRLQSNNIKDISPLSQLHHLHTLILAFNPIKDLTPLATLKKLRTLYLDEEQMKQFKTQNVQYTGRIVIVKDNYNLLEPITTKIVTYLQDTHLSTDVTTRLQVLGDLSLHIGIPIIGTLALSIYALSKTTSCICGRLFGLCRRSV